MSAAPVVGRRNRVIISIRISIGISGGPVRYCYPNAKPSADTATHFATDVDVDADLDMDANAGPDLNADCDHKHDQAHGQCQHHNSADAIAVGWTDTLRAATHPHTATARATASSTAHDLAPGLDPASSTSLWYDALTQTKHARPHMPTSGPGVRRCSWSLATTPTLHPALSFCSHASQWTRTLVARLCSTPCHVAATRHQTPTASVCFVPEVGRKKAVV